jgi:2-polyprenyl-3-methyl-5-hydroxy-6-metoxy-1,4-benzoquinol methylase
MVRHRFARFGFSEEMIRYGFVAASAFTLDLLTLHALYSVLHVGYVVAATVAFVAGAAWNYLWAVNWAFAYRRLDKRSVEFLSFWAIAAGSLLATVPLMGYLHGKGMHLVEARVLTAVVVGAASFSSKKLLLFTNYKVMHDIYRWYRAAPFVAKVHIIIRRLTFPLDRLLQYTPAAAGRVLEIGTGHGLVLITLAHRWREKTSIEFCGTDIDEYKIEVARAAAENTGLPITFTTGKPPLSKKWDLIIIADVLYLLSITQQKSLLNGCVKALAPEGVLLVKELGDRPRWKAFIANFQEYLAVNKLKLTARQGHGPFTYAHLPALAQEYQQKGFHTRVVPIDKGWVYPHLLLSIKK